MEWCLSSKCQTVTVWFTIMLTAWQTVTVWFTIMLTACQTVTVWFTIILTAFQTYSVVYHYADCMPDCYSVVYQCWLWFTNVYYMPDYQVPVCGLWKFVSGCGLSTYLHLMSHLRQSIHTCINLHSLTTSVESQGCHLIPLSYVNIYSSFFLHILIIFLSCHYLLMVHSPAFFSVKFLFFFLRRAFLLL